MTYLSVSTSLFIFLIAHEAAKSQILNTESTMRTPNSVEIQACVNPNIVLSAQLNDLKLKLNEELKTYLASTAVYHVQTYTNTEPGSRGGTCFMYVYQAISPEKAREAIVRLKTFSNEVILNPTTTNDVIPVNVKAFPWTGTEETFLNMGWAVKGTDLVLWGACFGSLLVVCTVGVCFLTYVSISKEQLIARRLLEQGTHKKSMASKARSNDKKKKNESSSKKQQEDEDIEDK